MSNEKNLIITRSVTTISGRAPQFGRERSSAYNLLEMIFRAGLVLIIELVWAALWNRGPVSELSANLLVRCESGIAVFLARFWPVLLRVGVRVRVGSTPVR